VKYTLNNQELTASTALHSPTRRDCEFFCSQKNEAKKTIAVFCCS